MGRRLKVRTKEMGDLEVYAIYSTAGVWEEDWRPLQSMWVADLVTKVPAAYMEHALRGLSSPLIKALGLPPWGALRRLPLAARECGQKGVCELYVAQNCHPGSKKMPWCYEPGDLSGALAVRATEVITMWRDGVYLIVLEEDCNAG